MVIHRMPMLRMLAAVGVASLTLPGCKIVSIQDDRDARERRSEGFDARAYVDKAWSARIVPSLERSAIDISTLPVSDLDAFGKQHGRQAGEDSPWTFVLRGEGTVSSVDRTSRQGGIALMAGSREIVIEIGPVITDSPVRDAVAMFDFNDFSDQMAYAALSRALNEKALAGSANLAARLVPGERVRFLGVAHVSPEAGPIKILPIRIEAPSR